MMLKIAVAVCLVAASLAFVVPEGAPIMSKTFPEMMETSLGLHMPGMVEPPGKLGRVECRLRAADRVLRQHKGAYPEVSKALEALSKSATNVGNKRVQTYFSCVLGMDMMLADCNSMPAGAMMTDAQVTQVDDKLKSVEEAGTTIAPLLKSLFKATKDSKGFEAHLVEVEQVVCDKPVFKDASPKDAAIAATQTNMQQKSVQEPAHAQPASDDSESSDKMKMGNMKMGNMKMDESSDDTSEDADAVVPEKEHTQDNQPHVKPVSDGLSAAQMKEWHQMEATDDAEAQ